MSISPSDIRVFVRWTRQPAFAGEDVECQIGFKNVAASSELGQTPHRPRGNGHPPNGERQKRASFVATKSTNHWDIRQAVSNGLRTTVSLSGPVDPRPSVSTLESIDGASRKTDSQTTLHRRSVSIISMGASDVSSGDIKGYSSPANRAGNVKARGHARSTSLQVVPRGHAPSRSLGSDPLNTRSSTQPSPSFANGTSASEPAETLLSGRYPQPATRANTAPNTPGAGSFGAAATGLLGPQPSFRFSAVPSAKVREAQLVMAYKSTNETCTLDQMASTTKVLSPSSISGTPRSSGEFCSLSTNSSETLASEGLSQPVGRMAVQGTHIRRLSTLGQQNGPRTWGTTLMMGYAQLNGSFILDGSLISQTPFEDIKRKSAVGGQGGGVIGVASNRRDRKILQSFGWGHLGGSIGGLLGGNELSSIKDMRGIANSRSIPLLCTPQSILFVDLNLGPGESRRFNYSFKLPRGLPPSHRGKAIKISYKLVIGIQRMGGAKEQTVKSVDIPFRVLGSVNKNGEILGHDLMAPYIILRDEADAQANDSASAGSRQSKAAALSKSNGSTLQEFQDYVEELLSRRLLDSSPGLLSPTEGRKSDGRFSSMQEPATTKEAIDMAIQHSNLADGNQRSANRFEIARSGKRVAVVMLARPSYRLGESIHAIIDFQGAEIPCYALHASLESAERIDKSLALRSEASVLRVTRKAYVSHSESTLFARRIVFSPTIPSNATPEFMTSGVSLAWQIRIEFVTPRLLAGAHSDDAIQAHPDLIEEIVNDDRGLISAAAEALDCESFEIAVPLRVYGAVIGNVEKNDSLIEGLVV